MTDASVNDAWAMAAAVRAGETSSVELVEESLRCIEQHEPVVNAFTVVLAEWALDEARAADARRGEDLPLLGVPVSVKDHIWLAGTPATNGSVALADFVPDVDAVPVQRLRSAGAIVVGKTNNPEFCYRGYTDNDLFGLTRNPWSPDRTPGGSSGGAGASVAYGAAPIGLGTDGGGSIRIPAAFCGVVGHKPTFGLVPKMPGFRGWPTLSVDGPLTRTVRDAALALSVMAGPSLHDENSWPAEVGDLLAAVRTPPDWSRLRVAVSEDLGWAPVDQSVRAAFRAAVDALVGDGARVTEAAPDAGYPTELWNDIALPEGFASEGPLLERWGDRMTAGTREIVEAGRDATARDYLDALARRGDYARSWSSFFEEYDVLLTPSMPLAAFGTDVQSPAAIDGIPVDPFFDDWCALALPANLTGCPACAVPTGFDEDGLPLGMQVMGPRFSDGRVLAVAAALERLAPWAGRRPPAP
ncbi:MAG: aspartyl-tRNA(Asn)/glutamyl-tRNA(Gln) amidotransferase subunit [Nocardioidaceae bacterium]|nr:aspartyl-tRNA(Asn)/glutamyl-tRNA(Gln) amidotransferase subunit [Nocardioidaceae bacterium]